MIKLLQKLSIKNVQKLSPVGVVQKQFSSIVDTQAKSVNPFHNDDYIPKYGGSIEKTVHKPELLEILRRKYNITDNESRKLFDDYRSKKSQKFFIKTVDLLYAKGIIKSTLLQYPWLLTMDVNQMEKKMNTLEVLTIHDTNEFAPFLKVSLNQLHQLVRHLGEEAKVMKFDNRVYYISEKLNVKPKVLTHFLSKRLFMLHMPLDFLTANLNNMINYGVDSNNILKDLWAFRYTPNSVKNRLERAKVAQKEKLMPWMVRCPERILQRSLKLSMDEKELLGKHNNIIEYISDRLGFTVEMTDAILKKHPATLRVRAPKIKEVLDFLLIEAGYSVHDVAQAPRILCHSLETTKERLAELKKIDCKPTSLVIVCKSKREYEKFVNKWMDSQKYKTKSVEN